MVTGYKTPIYKNFLTVLEFYFVIIVNEFIILRTTKLMV